MTTFPRSPRLLKGGIVLMNADSGVMERIIILQYNPQTLTRTLQVQRIDIEGRNREEALRLTGPPIETYKLEAAIDAADQLEFPQKNATVAAHGLTPHLAALETIIYPKNSQLQANNALANSGALEIAPMEASLTLFVWSKNRVMPMLITEFTVTEEAFDPSLNPIRAKVNLGMRVLNVNDLGFEHRGGNLFMAYHQQLEQLASMTSSGALRDLGLTGVP